MKFASEEIREKVVNAYINEKATIAQLAEIFGYTTVTIKNWIKIFKQEGRLAPKPNGHRESCFTGSELQELTTLLEKNVDMTLQEIKDHFHKTCCLAAIHRIVRKLGFGYKKKL